LSLLRHGWDYLADDKLVLKEGTAHLFESHIAIRDHHLRGMPWLGKRMGAAEKPQQWRLKARALAAELGRRILPKRYVTSWIRRWDRRHARPADKLFPEVDLLTDARPDLLVYLSPARGCSATRSETRRTFHRIAAVQQMMFEAFTPMEEMVRAFCDADLPDPSEILKRNIDGLPTVQLDVGPSAGHTKFAREFELCLAQA
jgi:hypothetical protein